MYLSHTRPALAYALSVVSQLIHNPGEQHMKAVMRILRYLKSNPGKGILCSKNGDYSNIEVYTDADWARQNFMIWKSQVLPSIRGNNLESLINGAKLVPTKFLVQVEEDQTVTTVENPEYIQWLRQDQLLLSWLLSTMTESVLSIVVQYTTSFEEVYEAMNVVEAKEEPILAVVEIGQPVRYVANMDIQDINVSSALIGGSLQDKRQHKQIKLEFKGGEKLVVGFESPRAYKTLSVIHATDSLLELVHNTIVIDQASSQDEETNFESNTKSPPGKANLESSTEIQATENTTQSLSIPAFINQEADHTISQPPSSTPHSQQPTHTQSTHPMITRAKAGIFKPKPRLYLTTSHTKISVHASVSEALEDHNWRNAMTEEMNALARNNTRCLVQPTSDMKIGVIQLDVNNAFLNGDLVEDVYMMQPEGFINKAQPNHVCKLRKALYGLKQAPRAWFEKLKRALSDWGFTNSKLDTSLFILQQGRDIIFVLIYVDDILITGSKESLVQEVIERLNCQFALKVLGPLSYFLGLEAHRTENGLHLSQHKYICDLLKRTDMDGCKETSTPMSVVPKLSAEGGKQFSDPTLYRSIVGALLYVTITRPEISYAVHRLSQYMQNPLQPHWLGCKRILRYLQGTADYGIYYTTKGRMTLTGYTDADWANNIDDRKSTGGYCIYLGNNLISWSSKKQNAVARSSTESEYQALANTTAEILWLQSVLKELQVPLTEIPIIWCDNTEAASLAANPVHHSRTKHIEIDVHFVRDIISKGGVEVRYVPTEYQPADIFTKALPGDRFQQLRDKLHILPRTLRLRGHHENIVVELPNLSNTNSKLLDDMAVHLVFIGVLES
ncbi:retrovirus-related pol polyprotein from transposon RE1 [Citrus sinensis]|uniref:Retrovirus-related pol polyprotein from transposon RE1 n=1 Tax=Citrus sinensis TaxID=2711 RepID=A0ACB8MAJ2_CITSI|nr:retrovirus-related pol polyprotein from transposon RE1 [Citrus sinensis]